MPVDQGLSTETPRFCPRCGASLEAGAEIVAPESIASTLVGGTHDGTYSEAPRPEGHLPAAAGSPFSPEFLSQYAMVKPLGQGGMGVVYLMRQMRLDRLVAVKVVKGNEISAQQRAIRDGGLLAGDHLTSATGDSLLTASTLIGTREAPIRVNVADGTLRVASSDTSSDGVSVAIQGQVAPVNTLRTSPTPGSILFNDAVVFAPAEAPQVTINLTTSEFNQTNSIFAAADTFSQISLFTLMAGGEEGGQGMLISDLGGGALWEDDLSGGNDGAGDEKKREAPAPAQP